MIPRALVGQHQPAWNAFGQRADVVHIVSMAKQWARLDGDDEWRLLPAGTFRTQEEIDRHGC